MLSPAAIDNAVRELSSCGIDEAAFRQFAQQLSMIIRRSTSTELGLTLRVISIVGFLYEIHRMKRLQKQVAECTDRANSTIFKKAGLFAKTQFCFIQVGKHRQQASWLSISLNDKDAASLEEEGHAFIYRLTKGDMAEVSEDCCLGSSTFCCGTPVIV